MGLGGMAAHLVTVANREELAEACNWAREHSLPTIMIGGGSNIVWQDTGFGGLVIVNQIMRYESFDEDAQNTYLTVGAGENWDSVVERAVQADLTGIEALSLIPGSTGATPIQNVGAYGQDIAQTLVSVETFDTTNNNFLTIPASDCVFGYRTSRFKNGPDRGRFYVTAITLHLRKGHMEPPFYATLATYLREHNITDYSPGSIREAVIAIRSARLPDPAKVHNNGSFFANPIVNSSELLRLKDTYPSIPNWPMPDGSAKLSAAWLIEQAGFKDFHDTETGMATWSTQPLVLVNEKAKNTADLLKFKQKLSDTVQTKFQVSLVQEPELLP